MEPGGAERLRRRGAGSGNAPRIGKEGGEMCSSHKGALLVKLNLGGE